MNRSCAALALTIILAHPAGASSFTALLKIDPTTGHEERIAGSALPGPSFIGGGYGLAFAPSGGVYLSRGSSPGLQHIDIDSGAVTSIPFSSQLDYPAQISVLPNGEIVAINIGASGSGHPTTIARFDPLSGSVQHYGSGNFTALATSANGRVFVGRHGSTASGEILELDIESGSFTQVSIGGLLANWPSAIAVDHDGTLVVSNRAPNGLPTEVLRIDPATGAQSLITSGGLLTAPTALAIGANGEIFVADDNEHFDNHTNPVFRVDAIRGIQTVVSGISGFPFRSDISSMLVADDGSILAMTVIPEPSTALLVGFGLAALAKRRRAD